MSHTVTVTRTTTTTTTSAIILNTGYMKTYPGILKLLQTILGIVVVGLLGHYHKTFYYTHEIFFLLMAVTFLIATFLLLLSCLTSISTASIISKTSYEVIYHGAACIMYIAASIAFLVKVSDNRRSGSYEPDMAAGSIGLAIAILYLFSTVLAQRSYRGL
ncbi:PREDICTED: uncharacterized protein LOC108565681 [Nicrophorus vespilloides]|uniref:Uncharacterized protein LOC108565681 n=1 Tax=Nicrophorus vespilloides TaxID=110193 RepID=A0ABM1N1P6_NICVS|nr:PREDICTED: uncharacterized protein LOC108565681 [Nicrophorus vespilloides]